MKKKLSFKESEQESRQFWLKIEEPQYSDRQREECASQDFWEKSDQIGHLKFTL